jgi:hypothetical protein
MARTRAHEQQHALAKSGYAARRLDATVRGLQAAAIEACPAHRLALLLDVIENGTEAPPALVQAAKAIPAVGALLDVLGLVPGEAAGPGTRPDVAARLATPPPEDMPAGAWVNPADRWLHRPGALRGADPDLAAVRREVQDGQAVRAACGAAPGRAEAVSDARGAWRARQDQAAERAASRACEAAARARGMEARAEDTGGAALRGDPARGRLMTPPRASG